MGRPPRIRAWDLVKSKPADGERDWRINRLANRTLALVLDQQPDLVAIEDYAFSKPQGATLLGEVGGVVKNRLFEYEIPYVVVQPTVIKAFAGHGGFDKDDMLREARVHWPDCPEHNTADAFWLAWYAYDNYDNLVEAA